MTFQIRTLAAAGALIALAAPTFAETEVKLGYALAADSHYGVAAKKFEEVVLAETGDQFSFTHFPSSGLGGEREVIEGLQLGTIEATIVSSGTLANFVPETGASTSPSCSTASTTPARFWTVRSVRASWPSSTTSACTVWPGANRASATSPTTATRSIRPRTWPA